jgi:hypothetical protein
MITAYGSEIDNKNIFIGSNSDRRNRFRLRNLRLMGAAASGEK